MSKHLSNGKCEKCLEILNLFPKFDADLRSWFVMLQAKNPEFHISCAGRGYTDQMAAFEKKLSRAKYGESAHNYNAALDFFIIKPGVAMYSVFYFNSVFRPEVPDFATWYGEPNSSFYELPHLEKTNWKKLVASGALKLVEPKPVTIA